MEADNNFMKNLSNIANTAKTGLAGLKSDAEVVIKAKIEKMVEEMELVKKTDLDALKAEVDALKAKIAELEKK